MNRAATIAGYVVIVLAAVVVEVRARRGASTPRLAVLVRTLTTNTAGRLLLAAGWLWVGWHLFVRVGG